MTKTRFFICEHCGNIIGVIKDSGVPVVCCGQKMKMIEPGTVDASLEKHVPVCKVEDGKVKVQIGSVEHPMTEEHWIEWVYLQTNKGGQRKNLQPGEKPEVVFALADETPISVFAYCNLHGLWKTDL